MGQEGKKAKNKQMRSYRRALAAAAGECSVCWHIIWHLWFTERVKNLKRNKREQGRERKDMAHGL